MSRGIHQNSELRRLWRSAGAKELQAELLETAPNGLSSLAMARWLVEHERKWLNKFGGLRRSINVLTPKIVLNEEALAELNEERSRCMEMLSSLESQLKTLSKSISEKQHRLDVLQNVIMQASWLRGLFLSNHRKKEIKISRQESLSIKNELESLGKYRRQINEQILKLKKHLILD